MYKHQTQLYGSYLRNKIGNNEWWWFKWSVGAQLCTYEKNLRSNATHLYLKKKSAWPYLPQIPILRAAVWRYGDRFLVTTCTLNSEGQNDRVNAQVLFWLPHIMYTGMCIHPHPHKGTHAQERENCNTDLLATKLI